MQELQRKGKRAINGRKFSISCVSINQSIISCAAAALVAAWLHNCTVVTCAVTARCLQALLPMQVAMHVASHHMQVPAQRCLQNYWCNNCRTTAMAMSEKVRNT